MAKQRKRFYVGLHNGHSTKRSVFSAAQLPTQNIWGYLYSAVIGPFRTKAGAQLCALNPRLFWTVNEYEKAVKRLRDLYKVA